MTIAQNWEMILSHDSVVIFLICTSSSVLLPEQKFRQSRHHKKQLCIVSWIQTSSHKILVLWDDSILHSDVCGQCLLSHNISPLEQQFFISHEGCKGWLNAPWLMETIHSSSIIKEWFLSRCARGTSLPFGEYCSTSSCCDPLAHLFLQDLQHSVFLILT